MEMLQQSTTALDVKPSHVPLQPPEPTQTASQQPQRILKQQTKGGKPWMTQMGEPYGHGLS